jgi:zinc/manganese transport system substrate-binding protein
MIISTTSVVVALAVGLVASGCAEEQPAAAAGTIVAVGAENQYTSVIEQIGGEYVSATSVMSNPNTDPHTFEASAQVAAQVSRASVVVQNGLGYDSFMSKIEAATPNANRVVISAQTVLGLPDSTANPHLWYSPKTMPAVAEQLSAEFSKLQPEHAGYFKANLATFDAAVAKWSDALATFSAGHPDTPVATTEPVADYMLEAAGAKVLTPWALQAAIMNDTDPAPQDVSTQDKLLSNNKVDVFLYNRQVTDSITATYLQLAREHHIPVVGVYETMPTDGYTYQSWMQAELAALTAAVTQQKSTVTL